MTKYITKYMIPEFSDIVATNYATGIILKFILDFDLCDFVKWVNFIAVISRTKFVTSLLCPIHVENKDIFG